MKYIAAVIACLLFSGAAQAQCYSSNYYRSSYCAPTYYPPQVITQYVPVAIPVFSAAYTPGVAAVAGTTKPLAQTAPPAPTTASVESRMLMLLTRFDQRMTLIEQRLGIAPAAQGGQPPPAMPPATDTNQPGQSVGALMSRLVGAKCASCHSDTTGAKGGLTLVRSGSLVDVGALTAAQRQGMLIRTYSNDPKMVMPPPTAVDAKGGKVPPLTDQEYGLLVAWLSGKK